MQRGMPLLGVIILTTSTVLVGACGETYITDPVGDCAAGETRECDCDGGLTGVQECLAEGMGWTTCDCGLEGADGDADGDSDGDADRPSAEICDDGFDNDSNGLIDEGCTCTVGDWQSCYPGESRVAGVGLCVVGMQICESDASLGGAWGDCEGAVLPTFEICSDGLDQDCDGLDLPCAEGCGDDLCDELEDCESCPEDCGVCSDEEPICGDASCEAAAGEDCETCPADCGACPEEGPHCGNGSCEWGAGGEDCATCPADCGACPEEEPVCGDALCEAAEGEDCATCPADCGTCPEEPAPCGASPSGTTDTRTMYQAPSVPAGASCLGETQTRTCVDGSWTAWTGSYAYSSCYEESAPVCTDNGLSAELAALSGGPYQNCSGWTYPMIMIQDGTLSWSGCCGYLVRVCEVEGLSERNRMYCDTNADTWCHPDASGICDL